MKIVATMTYVDAVIHAGGAVEQESVIIDLGDDIPERLRRYLELEAENIEAKKPWYGQLSFSLLRE